MRSLLEAEKESQAIIQEALQQKYALINFYYINNVGHAVFRRRTLTHRQS